MMAGDGQRPSGALQLFQRRRRQQNGGAAAVVDEAKRLGGPRRHLGHRVAAQRTDQGQIVAR